ncbi:serine/threonine protein kinase [Gardnerella vaginalis 6420LIT]|nr:serine/threonine protein kinase [Gardnerella vaginalis 6420LIT]EIK78414.1 serine/threonine protein kinase [Gardnerella vaginalis 6420B]
MFCANCGNNIIPGEKFCGNCGASVSYGNNVEQSQPTEVMQPTGVEQPTEVMQPGIQIAQPEYATPLIKNRKLIIISACVIAAVAIIAAAVFFFTFPHFRKAAPSERIVVPKAKTSQSAQDVVRELQEKGVETHLVKDFGGSKPGNFARYQNVKPGQVIHGNHVVTVVESKGPGIPEKGVIGKTVEEAAPLLKSMGVPVKVYKVASLHPGKIAATNPMPGEPLDENKEIFIGVGEEDKYPDSGRSVPVELFDKDKDEAYKMMSDEGFKVRLVPKYSSRKHLGKIVGSNLGLGQSHRGDTDITLYYGADASETKKMFTSKRGYGESNQATVVSTLVPFVGKWCTKSGDCLEFEPTNYDTEIGENTRVLLRGTHAMDDLVDDENNKDYAHSFGMWQFTQNLVGSAIKVYDGEKHNSLPMQNTLLFGDTGMVDIFRDGGDPYCGNEIYDVHSGLCVNGKFQDYQDLDRNYPDYSHNNFIDVPGANKGILYKMRAYFVLVPVNAKLDELEASGFFKGKGKTKPDMDRPFILRRDPKYYSKSELTVEAKDGDVRHNPFVPTEFNKPVPFAPAPDDSNVYYLVEKPFDFTGFIKDREL